MAGEAALALDPELPNLAPEVIAAYRAAGPETVAEIVGGELSLMGRPKPRHALATTALTSELGGPFGGRTDGPGGWVFLVEPELWLGARPDVVVPDLAGWRRERVTDGFLDPARGGITLAPDWVCEVLSPSTARFDRTRKRPVYLREGVRHLWFVDPLEQSVAVFRASPEGWILVAEHFGDETVNAEPFDAVGLDLRTLWSV